MFEIKKYEEENKFDWDNFIKNSKNGIFLFMRDYMGYHSDRFIDNSFLFYKNNNLVAVLPANINDSTLYSHQGLTYGGLIQSYKLSTKDVLEIFDILNDELKKIAVKKVIYKPVPFIYHRAPSQEDIYALYKNKAVKIGCNISSTIYQNNKIKFIESRKSGIRKSLKENVIIEKSERFDLFWPLLNQNLENKYRKNAVHSLEEINLLHGRFPENIKLFIATHNEEIVAGTVLYISENVVHVQYISANDYGKSIGALDLLFDYLINKNIFSADIFDFGQSTENMGEYLNENLIFQKEGFGGRGVAYDVYEYLID